MPQIDCLRPAVTGRQREATGYGKREIKRAEDRLTDLRKTNATGFARVRGESKKPGVCDVLTDCSLVVRM